ncbi:MAG: DUF4440 domain-containing protein [Blastocatellia bacterium]|nr:MAG: DUF4440 domain-containing protein [Blastocatellia bacterium]
MKTLVIVGLILTSGVVVSTHRASSKSDEAEIRQLWESWAKAFRTHDIEGIMAIYAPDVVAYDFVPPLQYAGKDAYRKDYVEFLAQFDGPIEVEFRDLKVFAGDNVGYMHALEHFTGKLKNGQTFDMWGRCTSGLRKVGGKWLDAHDHCSVPTDFDTGKAVMDLKP